MLVKYKGTHAVREGLYFALSPPNELPVGIEQNFNAVGYNSIQYIALRIGQVLSK